MSEETDLLSGIEALEDRLTQARASITRRFIGQERVVDLALSALLCGGHGLVIGLPGLGKPRLVETLSTGADGSRACKFIPGPVFCQLLMADEINRASPRTQSALLQAMQERKVTVAGQDRPLAPPFHVLATQNPIEQEGTYPLPEAQLDRFLVRIDVGYPDRDTERAILLATTGVEEAQSHQVFSPDDLIAAQTLLRRMPVGESVMALILDLVRAFRPEDPTAAQAVREAVAWGPGPRAAQALMLTVRARAMLQGRLAPDAEDVAAMAAPVLSHRMALSFAARAGGQSLDRLIAETVARITRIEEAA